MQVLEGSYNGESVQLQCVDRLGINSIGHQMGMVAPGAEEMMQQKVEENLANDDQAPGQQPVA